MKKIFTHLFVLFLLSLVSTSAWAQFTNGKVYRIVCSGTPSVSLGASALSDVAALSTSETDRAQQWYVTGSNGKYTFRNLANGRYLLGHKDYSNEWRLTEESNEFTVDQVNGNYAIYQTSHGTYYTYMHKDGNNNIVSWESSAANSQWTPYEVSYTAAELQAIWNEVESFVLTEDAVKGYEEKLMAIFTDQACTQLNSTYASKSVSQIEADANYQALPATLQAMVLKVKNNDWSEANAVNSKPQWGSDYAKKFRVQMYEPYSIEGEITSYLRINAHCNMDNPTGLYANSGKAMYIMVEGEIKEGAELWVAYQTGLGATNYYNNASYTQLREGLNVVPYFYDTSSLWINYVVHTYNANGATIAEKFPHKLSDYKPLKIHIEGGHINGYYNAIGDFRAADSGTENLWGDVDNDDDWNYYMERAPLDGNDGRPNRDFPLLAHRQTLLFPLATVVDDGGVTRAGLYHRIQNIVVPNVPNCYGGSGNTFGTYADSYPGMGLSTSNGKINIMLEAWDRIMYSQLASMGVVSKSTMDKMNALYPRWTSAGTTAEIYDYNNKSSLDNKTYLEFCNGIDYSEYFNHHGCGVGWPNGYMSGGWRVTAYHYETMEGIIGTMASSSGSTWGPAHEIGHQHQSIINLEGQTEVTNNLFSNIAVWYMGMATSRYDGSQGSLESVLGAFTTEGSDLYTNNIWALTHLYYRLWLYYHLAGNNTQFWPRLFELCRQVPLENHTNGTNDGSTTLLRFYQHACDAAGEDLTEFFRAHGYLEVMDNRVVGDYYGATYNQTQEQIDAAIASVKAKKYPANYAVLLINDGTSETTFKHNGATRRGLWDGYATAEFGSVNDFISGDADVTTNYEASLDSDGSITMTGGEGGIGFLMFNEKGELVAFSNKSTFKLGKEAKELYQNGQARIVVVNADNDIVELGEEIVPEPEEPEKPEEPTPGIDTTGLQALIEQTEALVNEVATVKMPGTVKYDLQRDNASGAYYISTNAGHNTEDGNEKGYKDGEGIRGLLDEDPATYFHSRWEGTSVSGDHYLQIDLGEGNEMQKFIFEYATRKGDNSNSTSPAPTAIEVYAGNDAGNMGSAIASYTKDANNLPAYTNLGGSWTSSVITAGSASRYLRFTVTSATGPGGSNLKYFAMSTFKLYNGDYILDGLKPGYEDVGFDNVKNAFDAVVLAKSAIESSTGLENAKTTLQAAYDALNEAYTAYKNALNVKKTELQELIDATKELVATVADVSAANAAAVDLRGKLYAERPYTAGGTNHSDYSSVENNYNLLDNSVDTHFHSDYNYSTMVSPPYIRVDLGEGESAAKFKFNYTTRNAYGCAPTKINVYAGNEQTFNGTPIATFTINDSENPLPETTSTSWTSSEIELPDAYRYFKFEVDESQGSKTENGVKKYYFVMSEFGFTKVNDAVITVKDEYKNSNVTEDLIVTTNSVVVDAETLLDKAASADELDAQIAALQAAKNDLQEAMGNVVDKTELSELIAEMEGLLEETTENGAVETGNIALQATDDESDFYIWSNATAWDCDGIGALIDKNDDGTAKTGTFFGTEWYSKVDAYTHYIEIDLGADNVFEDLSIDYTTRESGAEDSRPNGLKFMGSNDKVYYEEFHSVTEGLPAEANTKWSTETPIELAKSYRYIRIAVLSPHGSCFNMSDFNLYSHCIATMKEYYSTSDIFDCLPAAMRAYCDAKEALSTNLSSEDYAAVKDALAEQVEVLKAIVDADVADKSELGDLAEEVKTLVAGVVDVTEKEDVIPLQCDDAKAPYYIYCNAPGATNNYDGDNLGVAALLDVDDNGEPITATFLHTSYVAGSHDDDLDHYLRVDMGENMAVETFKFRYTPRIRTENAPLVMLIEGSNDCVNFEEITILTDMDATYQSGEITNGKAYRYIRFMVKETYNHSKLDGHEYFTMSHFEMITLKTIAMKEDFVSPNLTALTVFTANNRAVGADALQNCYVAKEEYDKAIEDLEASRVALETGIDMNDVPVIVTIDANNPVLYKIKINRSKTAVLEYDGATDNATKQVAVAEKQELGNKYQAWYFMRGTAAGSILILPYYNEGSANKALRLGAASTGDAHSAVWAVESSDANKTKQNWYITVDEGKTAEGWWNIRPEGKDNYFSNNNGVNYKMGFWNSSSDDGSEFQFVLDETDYSLSDAYYALYNLCQSCGGKKIQGTAVGEYSNAEEYNNAYNAATHLLDEKTSTDDEYTDAFTALSDKYNNLELVLPKSETENGPVFYTITNVGRVGGKMFAGDETEPVLWWDNKDVTAKYIFTFEPTDEKGKYYLKSLERGTYLSTALSHGGGIEKIAADKNNAKVVTINNMSMDSRAVSITPEGGAMLHADASGIANRVVAWNNNEANNASAWLIDEVTDLSQITHEVKMNATFSSVMLGYHATVPAGVDAYNAEGVEGGYVSLVEVAREGGVIPANTPVILYRRDDTKEKIFTYTEEDATNIPDKTVLGGSLYTKYVKCNDDADYYKLMIKGGEAKMYWMYKEFDENGTYGKDDAYKGTDNGGHIKCSANKIYMALPSQQKAASYGMRFVTPGATDIDEVNGEDGMVKTIYDLQGRKLDEITEPGFYIVNGKKILVK